MKLNIKRLLAYLLDLSFLFLFLMLLNMFIPKNDALIDLNNSLGVLNEMVSSKDMSFITYAKDYSTIIKLIDIENLYITMIQAIYLVVYFILIPYYNKGQTLFQSVFNIKIKTTAKNNLTIKQLLIRSLIINGLGFIILSIVALMVPYEYYFTVIWLLLIIQLYLMIKSGMMIYKNEDQKGFHDIYSHTKIEEIKK